MITSLEIELTVALIYHLRFKRLELFDNFTICSSSFLDKKPIVKVALKNLDLNMEKNGYPKMLNEPSKEITIEGRECFVNMDLLAGHFEETTVDGNQCWKLHGLAKYETELAILHF